MRKQGCEWYAKTLYKPERPKEIDKAIREFTGKKVPYFFIYAKDKDESQVENINNSITNKLNTLIPNPRINTRKLGLKPIDYKYLMHDVNTEVDEQLIEKYTELNNTYHFKISMKDEFQNNLHHLACQIRDELSQFGYSEVEITDILVKHLYEKKNRKMKELLWFCFGKYIVDNLKRNYTIKKTKIIQCIDCGEWFEVDVLNSKTCRCSKCQHEENKRIKREYWKSHKN